MVLDARHTSIRARVVRARTSSADPLSLKVLRLFPCSPNASSRTLSTFTHAVLTSPDVLTELFKLHSLVSDGQFKLPFLLLESPLEFCALFNESVVFFA